MSFWRSIDPDAIYPGFLRYWSRGREFREQLHGLMASTDMAPYLSLVDQRRLRITLPPPVEQRAIARILGTLDDKIELNWRMNETLQATARALFKSWFVALDPGRGKASGTRGFPGMAQEMFKTLPSRFTDSPQGWTPTGWRWVAIGDIAEVTTQSLPWSTHCGVEP